MRFTREPCPGCGDTDGEGPAKPCLLKAAIMAAPCNYCEAASGDPCVTFRGNQRPDPHIDRSHAGHVALVEAGTPCRASELCARGRNKGHTRENWNRKIASEP